MFSSTKYSYLILRLGLAAVFLWFGVHKFFNVEYWLNAWVPQNIVSLLSFIRVSGDQFIYLLGIFEILVGISLISEIFTRTFCLLAAIFLIVVAVFSGLNEVTVRDFGLIGSLLAIFIWPSRRLS